MIARKAIVAAMVLIWSGCVVWAQTDSKKDDQVIGILLAAGDISSCPKDPVERKKAWVRFADRTGDIIRAQVEKAETNNVPVHVLALGDLAYEEGSDFAERWGRLDDVLLPVPGNHEYNSEGNGYFKQFGHNAFVNQNGEKKGYFSLNFPRADGPWLLIGLNDNFEENKIFHEELVAELDWLETQLSKVDKQRCLLAFWHRPTFSSGKHGHDYKKPPVDSNSSAPMPARDARTPFSDPRLAPPG